MKREDISYDPFDVTIEINPRLPMVPIVVDAWEHIGKVVYLDPRRVKGMEGQPRHTFESIIEMGRSIRDFGQESSVHVFPIDHPDYDVELNAGERRARGCLAMMIALRSEIRPVPPDRKQQMVRAVIENCNRHDLTLVETIKAVALLIADGHDRDRISVIMGKTRVWVDQFVSLTKLVPEVLSMLAEERGEMRGESGRKLRRSAPLSLSIALEVAKLPADAQLPFSQMLIEEGVQIESARDMVKHRLREAGLAVPRVRSPKERFDVLDRECHRFEVLIARFLEYSPEELRTMAAGNDEDRRDAMVRRLHVVASDLERLAKHFSDAIPKSRANTRAKDDRKLPDLKFTPWTWNPAVRSYLLREVLLRIRDGELHPDDERGH